MVVRCTGDIVALQLNDGSSVNVRVGTEKSNFLQ